MYKSLPSSEFLDLDALAQFSKIRLVVLDLDGTLVKHQSVELNQLISDIAENLKHHRYGVSITLATGRTLCGVTPLIKNIPLSKKFPIILYNGSVIIDPYTYNIIRKDTIGSDSSLEILKVCKNSLSTEMFAYFVEEDNFSGDQKVKESVFGWSSVPKDGCDVNGMEIVWQDDDTSIFHAMQPSAILINEPAYEQRQKILSSISLLENISCTNSGGPFIEVRPISSNKAIALGYLAKNCGIDSCEILAVGDNDNDAEMLEWAGIGVSVAKASQLAMSYSDYVCSHGVAEGVVEVLRIVKSARYYYYKRKR